MIKIMQIKLQIGIRGRGGENMPRLVNSELEEYFNKTNDVKTKLNEVLYNHYTQCYFLSKTGSIKGKNSG